VFETIPMSLVLGHTSTYYRSCSRRAIVLSRCILIFIELSCLSQYRLAVHGLSLKVQLAVNWLVLLERSGEHAVVFNHPTTALWRSVFFEFNYVDHRVTTLKGTSSH